MSGKQRGRDKVEKLRRALFRHDWSKAETVIRQIPEGKLLPSLYVDQERWSVLHIAAMVNAPAQLVEKILDVVDVKFCMQRDANGNNPLHKLCSKTTTGNHVELVGLLALKSPSAFHELNTEDGKTPFDLLLDHDRYTWHELWVLLADIAAAWPDGMYSTNRKGENLLHRSVRYCATHGIHVANVIVNAAPELLERTDETSATPLHKAVRQKGQHTTALVELLVNQEGNCALDLEDGRGRTPLHEACAAGFRCQHVIEILVNKYPEALDVADNAGRSPLALFRRQLRLSPKTYVDKEVTMIAEVAMTLITRAPVRCSDSPSLHSLLRNEQCTMDLSRFIVRALSDQTSIQDEHGCLPLHFICAQFVGECHAHYEQVVEALVTAYPAACKTPDNNGMLPLEIMIRSGKTWNSGIRLVFLQHPAAVAYVGVNGYSLCALLEKLGRESMPTAMFRLLKGAPNLLPQ